MTTHFARRTFTADEYYRMVEVGILTEDDHVELLNGEIVYMSPIGPPHASLVARITRVFYEHLPAGVVVWPQNPVEFADLNSVPQPDVAVLRADDGLYETRHPQAADTLLVVEVAESSLAKDRRVKLPIYATAGIREYWIVDVAAKAIDTFRDPDAGRRAYRTERRLGLDDRVRPVAFPDVEIPVSTLLGTA